MCKGYRIKYSTDLYIFYIYTFIFTMGMYFFYKPGEEKNHVAKQSVPCTAMSSWSGARGSEPLRRADSVSLLAAPAAPVSGEPLAFAGKPCQGAEDRPARQTSAGRPRRGSGFLWALRRQESAGEVLCCPWATEQPPLWEARRGPRVPI